MGDRETRIRVAWHMGAERSLWDSVSWVKGFLPPSPLPPPPGLGSLVPGIRWFLGLAAAMPRRERDICVCDQLWGQQFSSCVDGVGCLNAHKQTNK